MRSLAPAALGNCFAPDSPFPALVQTSRAPHPRRTANEVACRCRIIFVAVA